MIHTHTTLFLTQRIPGVLTVPKRRFMHMPSSYQKGAFLVAYLDLIHNTPSKPMAVVSKRLSEEKNRSRDLHNLVPLTQNFEDRLRLCFLKGL